MSPDPLAVSIDLRLLTLRQTTAIHPRGNIHAPAHSPTFPPGHRRAGRQSRRDPGPGERRRARRGEARRQAGRPQRHAARRGLRRPRPGHGAHPGLEQPQERRAHHHDLRRRPERDRPGQEGDRAKRYGSEPKVVQDLRRVLDDKSIDAISIATPNHWHALATIWACQAGKDVYVEKPVSHNVSEGRRMVEAARKYNRIVQTGTQCRSHKGIQDADRLPPLGQARPDLHGQGALLQAARLDRPQGRRARFPPASTTTSGSARPRSGRSTPTGSTTTGTGSGTTATATSATRASTRWTSPAGAWARTSCPRP